MKTLSSLLFLLAVSLGCSSVDTLPPGQDAGCEVPTNDDNSNCGGCGIVCTGEHASMDCDVGVCVVDQCEPGFEDCDLDPGNGCESSKACEQDGGIACSPTATSPAPCGDGKGWCNPSIADGGPVECCQGCLVHDGAVFSCAATCPAPNTCSADGFCVVQ